MEYEEVEGNLITMALDGKFNVIAHGCNCFCKMKTGLAPQMAQAFGCNNFALEREGMRDINKLGLIVYEHLVAYNLTVVNCYTQYYPTDDTGNKYIDYEALTLCLRKMNHDFEGAHIGLPQIGCHLAGGDWTIVKQIIQKELADCNVTIVIYKPN